MSTARGARRQIGLPRDILIFLLGFTFGTATVTVFRHEVRLSGRADTVLVLIVAGAIYVGTALIWLRRLQALDPQSPDRGQEWFQFVWVTLALLIMYLTLVVVFLVF